MVLHGLAALWGLSACDGGKGPPGLAPQPPLVFAPVYSEIQANVLTPSCATAGCHAPGNPPLGLVLDAANSYTLLVGVDSAQVPGVKRVQAGDPDASYLVQKLEGTAAAGAQMPFMQPPLAQATIDIVRQWITDGALDDRATSSDPVRVTSLSPAPGAMLDSTPAQIIAGFDRELDASTVNLNTFLLEGSGGDGSFGDGNESSIAAASITVPAANPQSAVFDLGASMLADDLYRVTLAGEGPSFIMDLDANALDGEFGATFPSGDGVAGGDFLATFNIMAPAQPAPTLDDIQANVFGPLCSSCHGGPTSGNLPSGMDLSDADASFSALVGVQSLQVPALLRVAANDPDMSYLVHKLEGTQSVGSRMPQGGPFLDQATIDGIRQWIADGAQR